MRSSGNVLDGGGAHGGGAHAQAVDQHQRLAGVGAAQEDAGGLSRPARAAELDEGLALQQLGERHGAGAVDVVARDDLDVAQRVDGPLRAARGGDDHRVERLEGERRCGRRGLLGVGAQSHRGGEAGEGRGFHGGGPWSARASVPAGSAGSIRPGNRGRFSPRVEPSPLRGPSRSGRSPGSPDLTAAFPRPEGRSGWREVHTGLPLRGQRRHFTGFPYTREQPR